MKLTSSTSSIMATSPGAPIASQHKDTGNACPYCITPKLIEERHIAGRFAGRDCVVVSNWGLMQ